jgi:hypothetical protein
MNAVVGASGIAAGAGAAASRWWDTELEGGCWLACAKRAVLVHHARHKIPEGRTCTKNILGSVVMTSGSAAKHIHSK